MITTKVTRINGRFHVRLYNANMEVLDEMACDLKCDIGYVCYELMRWYCKLGGNSSYAKATRHRNKYNGPKGRIYYRNELENEKSPASIKWVDIEKLESILALMKRGKSLDDQFEFITEENGKDKK